MVPLATLFLPLALLFPSLLHAPNPLSLPPHTHHLQTVTFLIQTQLVCNIFGVENALIALFGEKQIWVLNKISMLGIQVRVGAVIVIFVLFFWV